jgi:ubiquinone/menaquinone biosynthesis C-methylase UbiE
MLLNDAHVRYTAAEYNRYTRAFVKPYDEMMLDWVRQQAQQLPPAFTLVDIGTGTAQLLLQLAAVPDLSECRLVGTDLFADMIAEAEAEVRAAGLEHRIELRTDDIHASRLPSDYADLIVSRSTLHHWSDPALGLKEIYRILAPGGRALIVDVRRDAPAEVIAEFNRQRAEAGITPSVVDEKFTVAEVEEFIRKADIADFASVAAGKTGLQALGLAVAIRKPRQSQADANPAPATLL